MKRTTLLLSSAVCLLTMFSVTLLPAQTGNPAPEFRQEIGLDLSMPLHQYWGASLLYKHRIGRPGINKWRKTQAIRMFAGAYTYNNAAQAE